MTTRTVSHDGGIALRSNNRSILSSDSVGGTLDLSNPSDLAVSNAIIKANVTSSVPGIAMRNSSSATRTHMLFQNVYGTVGSVSTASTGTNFNTTSDYRLKENVIDYDETLATTLVKNLHPVEFNFIVEPETTCHGFIAHEVGTIDPTVTAGTKDAVDEYGNIIPQGVDQSKLVPHLVACIKGLIARIEALEAAVNV